MRRKLFVIIECFILLIFSCILCFATYCEQAVIKVQDVNECLKDNEKLTIYLDRVEQNDSDITIQGWSFIKGQNTEYFDTNILLKSKETGEYFQISTSLMIRKDVTNTFGDGEWIYDNSGFFAKAEKTRLISGDYEIYIMYNIYTDNILHNTEVTLTID